MNWVDYIVGLLLMLLSTLSKIYFLLVKGSLQQTQPLPPFCTMSFFLPFFFKGVLKHVNVIHKPIWLNGGSGNDRERNNFISNLPTVSGNEAPSLRVWLVTTFSVLHFSNCKRHKLPLPLVGDGALAANHHDVDPGQNPVKLLLEQAG